MKPSDLMRNLLRWLGIAAVSLGSSAGAAPAAPSDTQDAGTDAVEQCDAGDASLDLRGRRALRLRQEPLWATALRAERAGLRPGASVAAELWEADGFERIGTICELALSPSADVRLALAQALAYPLPAVGAWTALELLSKDANPAVRLAAERAAWARRLQG